MNLTDRYNEAYEEINRATSTDEEVEHKIARRMYVY